MPPAPEIDKNGYVQSKVTTVMNGPFMRYLDLVETSQTNGRLYFFDYVYIHSNLNL